ncbi:diacylglycerol kinase family protein [Athalassotoga saccharophila]|uniref:diacylglycerol kinase family protein n=1 Tax=Athalassotoga saccharophila TaxID=1441386 RepID=UPI001E3F2B27|nr:diacylglycerol kinase family protein [Athalassotoga saccharophila]BBJ27242.1 undecaprenol kinase [Athalassotoga saccharophila]
MKRRTLINSFKYAFNGMAHALSTQRNMKIHFASAAAVIIVSLILKLEADEFLWIFLAITLVLLSETFNSFFEEFLDFVNPQYSEKVKHMKDMAAGGVLTAAIFAVTVAIIIFGKRFGINLALYASLVLFAYLFYIFIIFFKGGKNGKN